jgi:hypothetical protein
MLEKQAIEAYMDHGCLGVEIYRDANDPHCWMEINRFRDKQHYKNVVTAVEDDPRVGPLYKEFMSLFNAEEYQPEKRNYFKMI